MIGYVVVGAVCFVAAIFVYRNNTKKMGELADKVDELHDKIKDKLK